MTENVREYINLSLELDRSGLIWHPEIGDEVTERASLERVAILVDPQGLSPSELRESFIWLPTVEQLVVQFEARQAMIFHAGITPSFTYEAIIRTADGIIEASAATLRMAFGMALRNLLGDFGRDPIH